MSFLDVRTVFVICTGFLFIYGLGMIAFARKTSHSFNGIYLFAAINFLMAIGISLASLRDYINIAWSIVVANSLLMLATNLVYYAHLQFIGHKKQLIPLSVFLLISAVSLLTIFTYSIPNTNARIIVLSIFHCLQLLLIASTIWNFQRQTEQTCYKSLMVAAIIFALFFIFRIITTLLSNDIHPYKLANNILHSLLIVFLMLYIAALDFFIVLIATEKLTQKIAELAHRDTLTTLYNRRGLDHTLQNNNIFKKPLAIIMGDIDNFKLINDCYGHNIGDIVIQAFALIIQTSTRKTDICVRWGGEEFLIILPLTDEQEAFIVAEKIRLACEQQIFPEQAELSFTASFGICVKKDNHSFDALINDADRALYQAKHQGRNQVCIFQSIQNSDAERGIHTHK